MIPRELLEKIRRIEIRTSHMVNDVLAGQYHSAFKGRGMEFEEVRNYQIGDDVRLIDWNVSARYGEPYVKVMREERELTVMLLVDLSRSHQFGTATQLKRELATEVCATLAFSAIRNNDNIGLIMFTDRIEQFVPPKKGTRHVLRLIRDLLYCEPEGKGTDLTVAFEHLDKVTTRRCVVFLVSDFQASAYEQPMRIAKRRHDLIPVTITDRREGELPNVGLIELLERLRQHYAAQAIVTADDRDRLFRKCKLDSIDVRTGETFVEPLTRFFKARKARA